MAATDNQLLVAIPACGNGHTGVFIAWETCRSVRALDRAVMVNGQSFCKACSPSLARWLAKLMRRLCDMPRDHVAMMVFSPMAAIRAFDLVSREAFSTYDPLAAAAILCPQGELSRLARRIVSDRSYPLPLDPIGSLRCMARCRGLWRSE